MQCTSTELYKNAYKHTYFLYVSVYKGSAGTVHTILAMYSECLTVIWNKDNYTRPVILGLDVLAM
jgi:hypothetical protein